jgi:WG containing repeat
MPKFLFMFNFGITNNHLRAIHFFTILKRTNSTMNNTRYHRLCLGAFVLLPILLVAQLSGTSKTENSQTYYSNQFSEASTATFSTDLARKKLTNFFNLYREYSVSFDALEKPNAKLETTKSEAVTAKSISTGIGSAEFGVYLDKMRGILTRRLEDIKGKTSDAQAERSRYYGGMTMLKSAGCLNNEKLKTKVFGNVKTLDGINLIAFPLDSLRRSTRYGTVESYKEGYARIRKDQVYGFINLCGEEVITPQYEKAEPFNDGRALVKRVDWFFVSPDGEESEPLEGVVEAKALAYGISWARLANGRQVLFDNEFDTKRTFISQLYDGIDPFFKGVKFQVRQGKKVGIIGSDGKEVLPVAYDYIEKTTIEGVYKISQNNLIGLVDSNWTVRVPPVILTMTDFDKHGLAVLKTEKGFAAIDHKTFKMTPYYVSISEFNQFGVATFRTSKNTMGVMDTTLKIIIEPNYATIGEFSEIGLASACFPNGKCGFVHFSGKEQIKAKYESVGSFNRFGLAVARQKIENCLKEGATCSVDIVIDEQGNVIVPYSQESIEKNLRLAVTDSVFSEHYLVIDAVKPDGSLIQKMLINLNTRDLITPTPLEMIVPIDPLGIFRIRKDNLWGMIDSTGKVLARMQYKDINRQSEDYYAAQNDKGKWGYLNKKGRPQIPFEYDDVFGFKAGLAAVSKGRGKWGIINKFNGKIVPCVFKSVEFNEKTTDFEVRDADNFLMLLDRTGNCKTNCPKFEDYRTKANKEEAAGK